MVLLRHGQSELNRQHRFTGWNDAPLTSKGEGEAARAGDVLRQAGLLPRAVFVSQLTRAVRTSEIVCEHLLFAAAGYSREGGSGFCHPGESRGPVPDGAADRAYDVGTPSLDSGFRRNDERAETTFSEKVDSLPRHQDWRLNERHYGDLEGLGILQALRRYGPLPLLRCRRQWQQRPPLMKVDDPRFPGRDPRYANIARADLPRGESFADVYARLEPYYRQAIAPALVRERSVLLVSHKNTLHVLLMLLERIPLAEAQRIAIPTATPIVLQLDDQLCVAHRRLLR